MARVSNRKEYQISHRDEAIDHVRRNLPEISPSDAEMIVDRTGENFLLLENEIEKLKLIEKVSRKDIVENIVESSDVRIFTLIDTILLRSPKESIELLRKYTQQSDAFEFLNSLLANLRNP